MYSCRLNNGSLHSLESIFSLLSKGFNNKVSYVILIRKALVFLAHSIFFSVECFLKVKLDNLDIRPVEDSVEGAE